ncbi:39956_t:CDS:2 [Gigaspora margarita]|uniref:39956_t:CDS:1 n=1 Tax=Gigaspora margarita TaxID=4874 RepID=A0ABN7WBN9_GIGMA|nr:39956_t:CDS:2 [Gigaspora margarita]
MSSKFFTFLAILVLFLSAFGSSAKPLRRQANNCQTVSTTSYTETDTATPSCTKTYIVPTGTAIFCGTNNCITTSTTSYTTTDTSTPGCTGTYVAPAITAIGCGTCSGSLI